MQNLEGRVAVVTGAASGIGRGMAERWCAEGMKVVLADIEADALAAAERELRAGGADVVSVVTDVSSAASMDALARASVDAFGAVHLVCNNAGVGGGGMMQELTTDDWQWVLGVNLWGVIHGIRVFLPILLQQDEAHMVNTASMAGLVTGPFMGPYNATKFAVVAISETLFKEMSMQGTSVGVSVLCPGWVDTNIAESDRNRPAELSDTASGGAAAADMEPVMRDMLKKLLAGGLKPHEVAEHVADAVRSNRFYVLTHPEMKPSIETRTADILEDRNPSGPPMPF
jgi:NAD(P)-dependent dehydrogenase (short-subunit alcohol dehydrogenase family)